MTKPHWEGGSGGKGSAARNMEITAEEFASNWDRIFGKKEKTNEQRTRCVDGELESGRQETLHSTKDTPTENEGV